MQYGIPLLQVDAHELQQVLLNLIMNAADAMRPVVDRSRILRITSEVKRLTSYLGGARYRGGNCSRKY